MDTHFQTISPITQQPIVKRAWADKAELEAVLAKSESNQQVWSHTELSDRIKIVQAFCQWFRRHETRLAEEITAQMGRPIRHSRGEIQGLITRASTMANLARDALAPIHVESSTEYERFITPLNDYYEQ